MNEYKDFLRKSFDTIKSKQINTLFIDVSRNGGGSSKYLQLLLNYINHKSGSIFIKRYMKPQMEKRLEQKYQKIEGYRPFHYIWLKDSLNYQYAELFLPLVEGKFDGDVYLIQGYLSFSAALTMTPIMKNIWSMFLVGEESMQKVPTSTEPFSFVLPNSELICSCGSVISIYRNKKEDFVISDYLYPDIYYDVYAKRHLELSDLKKIISLKKTL